MESSKPTAATSLEAELTCSICTELLYQPLTLLDCLHTFCAACLKEWFAWQAQRAEGAPVPPAPETPVFTCPSCRDGVRDTKHDARVATLLDMFLALNPDKARSQEDRADMDRRYKKGDRVMPHLKFLDRTEEQKRLDAEERRLIEEVQQLSLRDALAAAERADRASRARGRRDGGERRGGERRAQSANLRVDTTAGEERRRRSESRNRGAAHAPAPAPAAAPAPGSAAAAVDAVRARQVEHQSSLRSLISAEGAGTRDIEREIEEFTRQIQEEGLLDGLDLDNIDLRSNDELSRRITEAYRRRYRERSRADGGRRSNASAHSQRSERSTRPRAHTGETSRPTSRHGGHSSRPPSASSSDERGRYPPSSSTHLEVGEPARRRRTPSGSRSATAPVPATQPETRGVTARSQTDLAQRPSVGVIAAEARSSSSPTTVTSAPLGRGDSPDHRDHRGASFGSRAAAGLGITQPPIDPGSDSDSRSRIKPPRPANLVTGQISPTIGPTSGPLSPGLSTPPLSSPRRAPLPRYKEPLVNCNGCAKQHIEYEIHYNCATCHGGDWNLCVDCWRRRKGCLHWLGFGKAAWERWGKLRQAGDPKWVNNPPHFLTANRYLPPRAIPGGAEGRRTITTENPADRLQSGTFCCRCAAWTNDGYWRCDVCNEGEWGFCGDCVNRGMACTHPLLPMAYQPTPEQHRAATGSPPPPGTTPPASPGGTRPHQSSSAPRAFRPVVVPRPCSLCRRRIQPADPRFHCYECAADSSGDFDVCWPCYSSLLGSGKIAPENGPAGWRRCPRGGHRMVVEVFAPDDRRHVVQDLVGGRRLAVDRREDGLEVWSWKDGATGKKVERLVAVDVGASTEGVKVAGGERFTKSLFPPDGGSSPGAVAGWGWYPEAGVVDELMFPKWAEILEVEDMNGEWFHGFYMGTSGLFPAPYVKVEKAKGG
ncbi:E3 ubiquitin-protein ligase [Echria macrotheca]|uniref:E3 ubiquitin-protein ligase n=1 Tax=Echria macrotheca TaxID=438768 RepID=A0AAJ0B7F9_9PEZI|nr:E3 ubiquitin-protein ligase [Echria macrotheca]